MRIIAGSVLLMVINACATGIGGYLMIFMVVERLSTPLSQLRWRSGGPVMLCMEWMLIALMASVVAIPSLAGRDGYQVSIAFCGLALGPLLMKLSLRKSLQPHPHPLVAFLAWPVWGRVNAALDRTQRAAIHMATALIAEDMRRSSSTA